jgi:myo-inositol-1-phosphate synthase
MKMSELIEQGYILEDNYGNVIISKDMPEYENLKEWNPELFDSEVINNKIQNERFNGLNIKGAETLCEKEELNSQETKTEEPEEKQDLLSSETTEKEQPIIDLTEEEAKVEIEQLKEVADLTEEDELVIIKEEPVTNKYIKSKKKML